MSVKKIKFNAITKIMDAKLMGAPEIVEHELNQYAIHIAEKAALAHKSKWSQTTAYTEACLNADEIVSIIKTLTEEQ